VKKNAVLILVLLLAGCSGYEWVKPGSTVRDREVTQTSCEASALKALPPDHVVSGKHAEKETKKKGKDKLQSNEHIDYDIQDANEESREVLIKNCMYEKGWTQIEVQN
jgi:hypothetical protein